MDTRGRILRAARAARGLSMEEAAGGIGISYNTLKSLEADETKRPQGRILRAVAEFYGIDVGELTESADTTT